MISEFSKQKNKKKILVSGIQASGELHIGNYFGAIKQMINLVNTGEYEAYIFIADYHSMTTLTNSEERLRNAYNVAATYLACGLDPKKVNIFKQSDIREVTELTWIFNTITPISMLFLAHSFKDKTGQSKEEQLNLNKLKNINAGLFDYPVLMASDILIYGGEIVPVGKDQAQHIEYTREIAKKYNLTYKTSTFIAPKEFIKEGVGTVLGLDGEKMSKSRGNTIPIFADDEIIKKKIMSIKTDSLMPNQKKNPEESNIYNIYRLFLNKEEDKTLREKFLNSDKVPYSHKEAKEELFKVYLNYFKEMKKKYDYYLKTAKGKKEVQKILTDGAKIAKSKAEKTLNIVRKETGLA